MAVMETAQVLKQGLEAELSRIEVVKSDVLARISAVETLMTEAETEKKEAFEQGYQEALVAAGQANGTDKIYSDAEMEAELAPLKAKIAELEALVAEKDAKIAELQALVDAQPAQVDAAVESMKAELLAQFDDAQKDDQAFRAKLAPKVVEAPVEA